ncbi:hypothetical protein ABG768_013616 [Culter alburnus]|uniref:Groucho/TLE N-terminal Q-rich domain-containing protein n=1 Tax=Culter alburnus TaxID=194366 RepID=A0AAW2B4D7_CULAL
MTSRTMYPHGRPQAPLVSGHGGMKFTVLETLDHIKEEFQLFQAQYHSLKLECEKLASEKTEMHRHYIMYYEMSYGLNIEMQKQAEIVKRLSAICTQIIPLLSQEHQHQVAQAVERSKHVSMAELNAIIGQQQFQHLSHHAPGFPLTPHPSGLTLGAGASLMALPGAFPFPPHLAPKDDITHPEHLDSRGTAAAALRWAIGLQVCAWVFLLPLPPPHPLTLIWTVNGAAQTRPARDEHGGRVALKMKTFSEETALKRKARHPQESLPGRPKGTG